MAIYWHGLCLRDPFQCRQNREIASKMHSLWHTFFFVQDFCHHFNFSSSSLDASFGRRKSYLEVFLLSRVGRRKKQPWDEPRGQSTWAFRCQHHHLYLYFCSTYLSALQQILLCLGKPSPIKKTPSNMRVASWKPALDVRDCPLDFWWKRLPYNF